MKAIWARGPRTRSPRRSTASSTSTSRHDWNDPLEHLVDPRRGQLRGAGAALHPVEGALRSLARRRAAAGVQLYVKRVFIMDDCKRAAARRACASCAASSPPTICSLNVSREILQQNRQIQAIRQHLVRRLLGALKEMKDERPEKYRTFWNGVRRRAEGGAARDRGRPGADPRAGAGAVHRRHGRAHVARRVRRADEGGAARDLLHDGPLASRPSSVAPPRGRPRQGLRGALLHRSARRAVAAPAPRARGQAARVGGQGRRRRRRTEDEKKQADEQRREQEEGFKDLLLVLRAKLQDQVKDVRLSSRLTSSAACLVGEEGDLSPRTWPRCSAGAGQEVPMAKRVLELNPTHPLLPKLQAIVERDRTDPAPRGVCRAALRAGHPRRGRPAPRPGRVQQAHRGPAPARRVTAGPARAVVGRRH